MHSQGVCQDLRLRWSPYPVKDSLRSQHHWFSWEAHALAFSLAVVLGILYWSLPSSPSLACLEPLEDLTESLSWTALGRQWRPALISPRLPAGHTSSPCPSSLGGRCTVGENGKSPGCFTISYWPPRALATPLQTTPLTTNHVSCQDIG